MCLHGLTQNMNTCCGRVGVMLLLLLCSVAAMNASANGGEVVMPANCSQISGGPLQELLMNISLTPPSLDNCVQINIAPGNYMISQVINVSRCNVILRGTGEGVTISFNVSFRHSSQSRYVMQFENAGFVDLNNIHFINSSGIIGFENVTDVSINNCTFRYFDQGAVDIYNCGYPKITNCTFQNSGPTSIIKPYSYRGHSGGLSIGLSPGRSLGYNPSIQVSDCTFIGNSAQVDSALLQTSSTAIQKRIFTGRGGGASILVNSTDPVYVVVDNCIFMDNVATSFGGGLYLFPDGPSNNTFLVKRTVFLQNRGGGGSGALHLGYIDTGTLSRLHSVFIYDSQFIENSGYVGGAVYFSITGIPKKNGEVGDYAYFKNCTFLRNSADLFGGAIAATSVLVLSNRQNIKPLDILDCTFSGNLVKNSVAGVLGTAYVSINFWGTNIFSNNIGSSVSLAGSVMRVMEGGSLQFIGNSNTGHAGGALYVSSFGQVIINNNVQIKFDGNIGSFGAAIVRDGYIPMTVEHTAKNSMCFLQHVEAYPAEWASRNISFTFVNNNASVGSSVYTTNIGSCSSSDTYGRTAQIFSLPFAKYQQNVNLDHKRDVYDPRWNVQTPPFSINLQNQSNSVSAYAGGNLKIYISVVGELGNPVSAVLRVSDTEDNADAYIFPKSLILYNDLYEQAFDTQFLTLHTSTKEHNILIATVQTHTQYQATVRISQQPCPFGYILTPQSSGFQSCQCNPLNPAIGNCSGTTVQFTIDSGGLWANLSNSINEYGDTMSTYPCPMGYCQCNISEQVVGVMCLFSVDTSDANSQCDYKRTGVLCGDCREGLGVSALLNQCVTCDNASGLLIALLIICDIIVLALLIFIGASVPTWLQPCLFYLQLFPYVSEHFPVTFKVVHPYLYYVSSGLSFYFVYDFCLYSEMSPLVSYFIRYIPLFTAIIACPIILAIRHKILPQAPWHGLWWIVLLMYTHVVHTSLSILNCPRLPGKDGNTAHVWYINGNIECFTGGHIPLAILAIFILILCIAVVPIAAGANMVPKWTQKYLSNLRPAVRGNYRDGVEWFGALDLLRRIIAVLLIVAFPYNEHPSIFLFAIIMSVYGFIAPYKHVWSTVMEVVIAVDAIIMLLLKNTEQFILLQVLPEHTQLNPDQGANSTVDDEDILGLTPLVKILVPFYYVPFAATILGALIWLGFTMYTYTKFKRNKQAAAEDNTVKIPDIQKWTEISVTEVSTDQLSAELSAL